MNGRERLMTVLRREGSPDRVPWAPLIDGYYLSARPPGTDILDAFREVEADIMERHVWTYRINMNLPREPGAIERFETEGEVAFEEEGVVVTLRMEPHPKGRLLTKSYAIPGRTLTESGLFTEQSPFLPFPVDPLIKSVEDLEAYEYVIKRRRFEPNYEAFVKEDERIGAEGIATDSGLTSPIQELLQHLIGIESFYTVFYTDHLRKLESLMKAMHESNLAAYEVMAESPAEVVIDYENTSTTFISPAIHRKYVSPCINDYADLLHEKGKILLTHRCGTLKGLVDAIRDEWDDGVVDISPEPTGDLALWEALEVWPDKVVLGGFDATFLTGWTAERIREYARQILDRSNGIDRLMLGSADAVPKTARVANLRAVGQFVKEWATGGGRKRDGARRGRRAREEGHGGTMTVLKELGESVLAYQPKRAEELTNRALDQGKSAAEILNEGLIPAMDAVGEKYEAGEIYVPEMLMAAKSMKAALAILRPILAETGVEAKGKVVIGTVEGDLHDIGQNLVSIMLEGAGYDVQNLGIDNTKEAFVEAVKETKAHVVALSALLTTTMIQMPEVIEALKSAGLRDRVKVIIGGAPVTQEYADQIGADGYAKDAAAAVTLVRELLN